MFDKELTALYDDPTPDQFPYRAVVAEYLRVGKHFVSDDLLKCLGTVRERLETPGSPEQDLLAAFLDTALDKWDGRYDYHTYIGLDVLGLPTVDVPAAAADDALRDRDRRVVLLAADLLRFELAAAAGETDLLPQQRPDASLLSKRCRLAWHAARPALTRLGLGDGITTTDPVEQARALCDRTEPELTGRDRLVLRLSLLPVYTVHDEYLFIRVLQLFETNFAVLAGQLRAAVQAMRDRDWYAAVSHLKVSEQALRESAPLFSLLATMQIDSFRTFRTYTEGASAIQSRNYKVVESLCRRPDSERLDSPAYRSVPEVRERVLAGQATLDEAFTLARADGGIPPRGVAAMSAAMQRFAATLLRWRQTHYRLAVRMLGERPGTGYTEGTPYLKSVRQIPVFHSVTTEEVCSDE